MSVCVCASQSKVILRLCIRPYACMASIEVNADAPLPTQRHLTSWHRSVVCFLAASVCACVWEHGEPSAAWRANALESLHSLHSRSALHPPLFHVFFCLSSFAPRPPLLVGGPDWGRAVGSPLSCTSVADLGLRPDQNRAARSLRERRELFHVSGIGHAGLREAWRGCKQ